MCELAWKALPSLLLLLLPLLEPLQATVRVAGNNTNSSEFADCPSRLSTLERALYETGDNVYELNQAFYPPNARTSRFIRVSFTFLDEMGEEDGCTVTYYWAIGILLFFQPPSLFTYNSLYFNYANNNLDTLYLKLPYECRPLISLTSNDECSCVVNSPQLDVLTQQVSSYRI